MQHKDEEELATYYQIRDGELVDISSNNVLSSSIQKATLPKNKGCMVDSDGNREKGDCQ